MFKAGKYRSCPHYPEHPCDGCSYVEKLGEREFCTYCPARVGQHENIKGQGVAPGKRCILCAHWHKSLRSDTCSECIRTLDLINFQIQEGLYPELYKMMEDEKNGKNA